MKLSYGRMGREFEAEVQVVADPDDHPEWLSVRGLPAKAVEYLLQYGWTQSLQDCIAGREKAVREEMAEENPDAAPDEIAEAIRQDIWGALGKRMDAILAGTVGTRVGGTRENTLFNRVAKEMLASHAKAKGKKLPKGEELANLLAKFIEANKAKIEAEIARRQAEESELDFDV